MHKSEAVNDYAKDRFRYCEDDLLLLRAEHETGSYLLNYYETFVPKHSE